jgi:hypothetical protein
VAWHEEQLRIPLPPDDYARLSNAPLEDLLPGTLGPVGRFLFTKAFLDRACATFMRLCLSAIERYVLHPSQG